MDIAEVTVDASSPSWTPSAPASRRRWGSSAGWASTTPTCSSAGTTSSATGRSTGTGSPGWSTPAKGSGSPTSSASTLDSTTAKVVAYNIQKQASHSGATLVVATSHTDLEEDLAPSALIRKGWGDEVKVEYRENREAPECTADKRHNHTERARRRTTPGSASLHYRDSRLPVPMKIYAARRGDELVGVIAYSYPGVNAQGGGSPSAKPPHPRGTQQRLGRHKPRHRPPQVPNNRPRRPTPPRNAAPSWAPPRGAHRGDGGVQPLRRASRHDPHPPINPRSHRHRRHQSPPNTRLRPLNPNKPSPEQTNTGIPFPRGPRGGPPDPPKRTQRLLQAHRQHRQRLHPPPRDESLAQQTGTSPSLSEPQGPRRARPIKGLPLLEQPKSNRGG